MQDMTPPPYPTVSEVADSHLSRAIESLDRKVSDGFDKVDRRIDTMVTRDAFDATVQRLDARDEHLDAKVESGFKDMDVKVAEGFRSVREADRERNTKNRWFWGLMVSFAAVLSGGIFGVLNLTMR